MIRTVGETGSTNADMAALALAGAAEGDWLRAERQSAGRGRQGRQWASEAGNLYASTLVRLRPSDPPAPGLGFVAAVALHDAVAAYIGEGRAVLKWPNDVLVEGAKLSGILLERTGDAVVAGFGVNLAHHPRDLDRPATSLCALGSAVAPGDFLETLAESLRRRLSQWRGEGFGAIREVWMARAHPVGSALSVRQPEGAALQGLFDGIDSDGALRLRLADGSRHVMHAGDIFLI
ncbi:biotin--[acetyl-CoA-carboxylase] ligase [Stakelama pacifica]|uniref:biotin--[biotin carboxyl-carrier protein] ligase n=1 Tax=Stakelama pacifica TaxID=517720 RepID=A0A4R6FXC2_9SPHN|nr:biotin--[acetyl-CoA-carboxylase] ligase [Stakelama pacifica]TDN86629.1 BirA family biotin operon repressor/biotin-[acetyl-CoA-carboxylase] ligase [Stakelama pacifica]GGO90211.1 biotin--[acetyl-CoA-carboxylase] ligase [Stakelama pacifica]